VIDLRSFGGVAGKLPMPSIMPDHNVEGHFRMLVDIWTSADWFDIWEEASVRTLSFERLGIAEDIADDVLWRLCQERDIVLLTGNRNALTPDSLELTIQNEAGADSIPVLTIADPDRLIASRTYAQEVAAKTLEYLLNLHELRGTGRLYVPWQPACQRDRCY
jgi:hypothetical protein